MPAGRSYPTQHGYFGAHGDRIVFVPGAPVFVTPVTFMGLRIVLWPGSNWATFLNGAANDG